MEDDEPPTMAPDNVIPISAAPKPAWVGRLSHTQAGDIHPTLANALIIMAHDPRFRGMLGHNLFTDRRVLLREPPPMDEASFLMPGPYPRSWYDEDISLVQAYMQRVWADRFQRNTIADAMAVTAMANPFHPVRDWLAGLVWDGKKRLDNWLFAVFDVRNEYLPGSDEYKAKTAYFRAVGAKFLTAAVRRIRFPGCKFDSMLILEGPQRIGKSTALMTLFGREWFSDAVPPDLANRDAAIALHGLWCLEFAEIDHLVRTEVETIKAFLSRSVDHYRPVHGRDFVDVPRQTMLAGTTNSDDYLRDTTGNTRMWPVACQCADVAWIELNRDQLWAEACVREAAGDTIWLDGEDTQGAAALTTEGRMSEEVWQAAIVQWLNSPERNRATPITSALILEEALAMPKERMNKAASMRVGAVMRAIGWERVRIYASNDTRGAAHRLRIWQPVGQDTSP
jgi:predicted P-loop ATPase